MRPFPLLVLAGWLAVLAIPAAATQEYILPTLFDVDGVAANDVLNLRAQPSASAPVVGTLAPDATGIEVTGLDASGRWGRVNVGETRGWAAMRYLAYRSDVWQVDDLPRTLSCFGTEPFWALKQTGPAGRPALQFTAPETKAIDFPRVAVHDSGVFRSPARMAVGWKGGTRVTLAMQPGQCSDGMSDRAYGISAQVLIEGAGPAQALHGCCALAP